MVEKPDPAEAPSTLTIIGRYIIQPEIFAKLEDQKPGSGNEIQLTDGLDSLIAAGQKFHGLRTRRGVTIAATSSAISKPMSRSVCTIRNSARSSAEFSLISLTGVRPATTRNPPHCGALSTGAAFKWRSLVISPHYRLGAWTRLTWP